MSTSSVPSSGAPAEESIAHSVFDFLYNDSRRVASYLSQFEGGHLTGLTRSNETGRSTNEESGRNFNLGMSRALGGSSRSGESEGVSAKEGIVRTFDPYWSNARTFLDYLSDRDLIERNITSASMGQFVLVRGGLAMLDLPSLQQLWTMPQFKQLFAEGMMGDSGEPQQNRQQKRAQGKPQPHDPFKSLPTVMQLAMELLPSFPHSIVASVIGEYWSTWSTLQAENIIGSAADLVLKHGSKIAGEWSMLGVLDALPDEGGDNLDALDRFALGVSDQHIVATVSLGLTPTIRMVAGRPAQSYGVTPLLIFREIAKPVNI